MKFAVEAIEGCKRRLTVEAPADVVQQAWERAYGRVQKQARLPGFRKGHVPRSLVKLHFADDVRRDVAEHLIPDVYQQAVTEARMDPVAEPDLQDVTLEEGAPLSFVAVVEVKPEIDLRDYKGVEVQHAPVAVSDGEVEEALGHMREQHAEFRDVDRAAAEGDLVIVDYTLALDGQEPSRQSGYQFVVGGGSVLPEVDAGVRDMRRGEEKTLAFTMPEDHRREDVRGKSGTGTVTVVEVKEKVLPELNDEFARTLGAFDTLDEVRAELRRQLEAGRSRDERRALEDKVVDAILSRHEFAVPEAMIMRQVAHQVEHARDGMRRRGMDPDAVPWDYGRLLSDLRPGAERAVRRSLLLDAIADREALAPSDADVDAEVERIAQASQRPTPAIRRMMEKSGDLDALRHGLRERMTLDFLIDNAVVRA
jgi:trigger factor